VRNVVVTGGTRGIGWAITQKLIALDYSPIIIARSPPINSVGCQFIAWDLSEIDTLHQLATRLREIGPIYGLVNNAGIGTAGILATMKDGEIARLIGLNVTATIVLTKYLIRSMMTQRAGRIVNMSSIVATTGYQGLAAYSASKAALIGFTKSLAREVGSLNITVNAIAPGFIATEMTHGLDEKQRATIAKRSALGRMASVDDVAHAVSFLLSDVAANITGTTLTVDAGNTA
jgi:3-oxoacyl-[acyl-carrier protein] reductase